MKKILLCILAIVIAVAISVLITGGFVYLICLLTRTAFSWKIALIVWLVLALIGLFIKR